jgi:hypothetical protein
MLYKIIVEKWLGYPKPWPKVAGSQHAAFRVKSKVDNTKLRFPAIYHVLSVF